MAKKTLADLTDLTGKRVLIRVDFNVPQDDAGNITNDRRIRAALPTIKQVLDAGAQCHPHEPPRPAQGRPGQGRPFQMDTVAERLGELLGKPVHKVDEVVGPEVTEAVEALQARRRAAAGKPALPSRRAEGRRRLARQLAALGDVYVNDAFGTCHREDASMVAVPAAMAGKPRVVGLLVAKELEILDKLLSAPPRPFVGILGGAKVSDKIGFIKALLRRVDKVLIGGAMTYTFMKAQGHGVGKSARSRPTSSTLARELLDTRQGQDRAAGRSPRRRQRRRAARRPAASSRATSPRAGSVWTSGRRRSRRYKDEIGKAATVVWNGPMGKFEDEPYSKGTRAVAEALAASQGVTVVGGGETAEAVEEFGLAEKMTHVSTGGGAFLEYVEGTPFAALAQIDEK